LGDEIQKTLSLLDDLKEKAEALVVCEKDAETGAETCTVPERALAQITPSERAQWGSYMRSYLPDVRSMASSLRERVVGSVRASSPSCENEEEQSQVEITITDRIGAVVKKYSIFGDDAEVRDD
jgi:hypothetical protein